MKIILFSFVCLFLVGCGKIEPIELVVDTPEEEILIEEVINIIEEPIVEKDPTELVVTAIFTKEFVDKYKYEDSVNYRFALYLGDGMYYKTFRNEVGGVSNDFDHGLDGAIPAVMFNDGYTRYIPLTGEFKVSRKNGEYGYKYTTYADIKTGDIRLSPTKETNDVAEIKTRFE